MRENRFRRFGSNFLLIQSLLWLTAQASASCQKSFELFQFGYEARLQLNGGCNRGLYILQFKQPNGRQQSVYQAYTAPVTGLWLARLMGKEQPDVVLSQELRGKLMKLQLYTWKEDRFVQGGLVSPSEAQLESYTGQDKVYVRYNQLVRQLQIRKGEELIWRRLTYDFKNQRWNEG